MPFWQKQAVNNRMRIDTTLCETDSVTPVYEGCDCWWMLFRVRSRSRELNIKDAQAMDLLYCLEEWAYSRDVEIGAGEWSPQGVYDEGYSEWLSRPTIQRKTDPGDLIPRAVADEWVNAVLIPWARLHRFDAVGKAFPSDSALIMRTWQSELRDWRGSEDKISAWRAPLERLLDIQAAESPEEPAVRPSALEDIVELLHGWAAPHGLRARAALAEQDRTSGSCWRIRVWFSRPRLTNGTGVKVRVHQAAAEVVAPWAKRYRLAPTVSVRTPRSFAEEVPAWTGSQGADHPTVYNILPDMR